MSYQPVQHPVYRVPNQAETLALGPEKWIALMKQRDERIIREREYPLRYGWEPPVWKLCDALLEWPWVDKTWAAACRAALGFKERVKMLLILGGNRGGKSEYAAKRLSQLMWYRDGLRVWPLHSSGPMSKEYQHPLFWKYLPPDCRRNVKGQVEYIAYKQKTGFSDDKFVLSNGSECSFRNYEQDKHDAIEGGDIDGLWNDELVPEDWIETELLRLATRSGWGVTTFTPVRGYSATVRMFLDGAETVLEETGYLLPKDGGDMDVARALGFADLDAMKWGHAGGRWSLPADPLERIARQRSEVRDQESEENRKSEDLRSERVFEMVPRVMRPKKAGQSAEAPDSRAFTPIRPNSWARSGLFQIAGSSSSRRTERSRSGKRAARTPTARGTSSTTSRRGRCRWRSAWRAGGRRMPRRSLVFRAGQRARAMTLSSMRGSPPTTPAIAFRLGWFVAAANATT